MKLVRFLWGDDFSPRSGFLHDGKIYETVGLSPVGIHEFDDIHLLAPISSPPAFRDFMGFEAHIVNTRKRYGKEGAPKEWYEAPAFFFQNPASIYGPYEDIPKPSYTDELDYELEVAVVIDKGGGDIPVEHADDCILGFTIYNDWSARDIQRREAKVGLGFAKGKDFANSIGPYLVTPDDLESKTKKTPRGNIYNLEMKAYVNGELLSQGNLADMHWTFAEMISYASQGTHISQGDLFGSGTVGTGCLLELGKEYLKPGDEVVLEVELLGKLINKIK